jgi:hypothetical protein
MHLRSFLIAVTALAAGSPSMSNAATETTALQACAKAFAASIASPGAAAPAFKLNYRHGEESGILAQYYGRQFVFLLSAKDPKTGLTMASATCSANFGGTILALKSTPIESSDARLAAGT